MFHQVELGSADPVQLNGRGYTVDDWLVKPCSARRQTTRWRHSHMHSC